MKSQCDNCGWIGKPLFELHEISNLLQRIEPGGVVPSGECPKCDCLCYPVKPKHKTKQPTNNKRAERAMKAVGAWRGYEVGDEADLRDLLTDLMHLCRRDKVDFEGQLAIAWRNFQDEPEQKESK